MNGKSTSCDLMFVCVVICAGKFRQVQIIPANFHEVNSECTHSLTHTPNMPKMYSDKRTNEDTRKWGAQKRSRAKCWEIEGERWASPDADNESETEIFYRAATTENKILATTIRTTATTIQTKSSPSKMIYSARNCCYSRIAIKIVHEMKRKWIFIALLFFLSLSRSSSRPAKCFNAIPDTINTCIYSNCDERCKTQKKNAKIRQSFQTRFQLFHLSTRNFCTNKRKQNKTPETSLWPR